jgi:hypothetical protein
MGGAPPSRGLLALAGSNEARGGPGRALATLGLLLSSACGAAAEAPIPEDGRVDLGTVVVGAPVSVRLPAAVRWRQAEAPPGVSVTAASGAVVLTWAPSVPGTLAGEVRLLDVAGGPVAGWSVTGAARAPVVTTWPPTFPAQPGATLWVWPETDLEVTLVGPWAACAPECARVRTPRATRGLAAEVVRGAGLAPTAPLTLRVCPAPACEVQVSLQELTVPNGCAPGTLLLPAAAVGGAAEARVSCPGARLLAEHPDLTLVDSSTAGATVRWRPGAAGPFTAALRADDGRAVPVFGYAVEAPPCALAVTPEAAVLGLVPVGSRQRATLTLRNVGAEACLVAGLDAWPRPAFVPDELAPAWLDPGARATLGLTFSPPGPGLYEGQVILRTSDPAQVHLPALGYGALPDLYLESETVDLGRLPPCAQPQRTIGVGNRGDAVGLVLAAELEGPGAGRLRIDRSFPQAVAPGEVLRLPLKLSAGPSGPLEATARLTLQGEAGRGEVQVHLRAELLPGIGVTDEFQQLGRPEVDVVVVLDEDPALLPQRDEVRTGLTSLAAHLRRLDARVAFLGTRPGPRAGRLLPVGRPAEQILSSQAPDLEGALLAGIDLVGTASTAGPNQGLEAIRLLLSAAVGDDAFRLLRPSALLHFIVITATDDASPREVSSYVNDLVAHRPPRTPLATISVIGGPLPAGCTDGDFHAEPAVRYLEAANRTGGYLDDLCDATWFPPPSTTTFGFKSRFFLTQQPEQATLQVEVDEAPVPARAPDGAEQWRYDYATNSIDFSPFAIPPPGSVIVVRYLPECL